MNENIKKIKLLLNEFIEFLDSHEVGELTRVDFKTWAYIEKSSDEWILTLALNDELFNKFINEIEAKNE